jgi:hypothetical protein
MSGVLSFGAWKSSTEKLDEYRVLTGWRQCSFRNQDSNQFFAQFTVLAANVLDCRIKIESTVRCLGKITTLTSIRNITF